MTAVTPHEPEDLNALDDESFRLVVRRWIEANYPPELRNPPKRLHWSENQVWYFKLAEKGWLCPSWPREHGGMGLSAGKQIIMVEEYERHGVARTNDHGILMVGPLLIAHGTQEQRDFFLPRILKGEHIWCQGYSEPNAGSDLANVQTRAVLDGEHWVVNGQKIWTSNAHEADWMFALVRTEPDAPKHDGITYMLIDMKTPGLTVRPLRQMTGEADFNEVFFENVRVPKDSIVGERGRGWYVSRSTLKNERALIGNATFARRTFDGLQMMAQLTEVRGAPVIKDPVFRDKLVELEGHLLAAEYNGHRLLTAGGRGEDPGLPGVVTKLHTTTIGYHIGKLAMDMMSDRGCLAPGEQNAPAAGMFGTGYMWYFGMALGGGAPNIQRNVIAERGLGLPRDPRR